MRSRWPLGVALIATLLFIGPPPPRVSSAHAEARVHKANQQAQRLGLINRDGVELRRHPSSHAKSLATLVQQQQVKVLLRRKDWDRVLIWDSIRGWIPRSTVSFRRPWETTSAYRAPEIHYSLHPQAAQKIAVSARVIAPTPLSSQGDAVLKSGQTVRLLAWRQDAAGKIWYRIAQGWALGDNIQFAAERPTGLRQSLAHRVAGKGMWVTLGTIAGSEPSAIVAAAQRSGITHLYLEAAISPLGFHGRKTVGHLIDFAHAHHLAVVAWVYPYLYDLAGDVELTRQVANFRTSAGNRFDGIAADLERNISTTTVRPYSQLIRAYLGSHYLLVGVTYPPQSFSDYPFSEVARSYDVIAPMDYWHQTKTAYGLDYGHLRYGSDYAFRYASDSIARIRLLAPGTPIAPIGQTFDNFGRLEMGPYAPSGSETRGFLAGSKKAGAIGASFFQWMTATNGEWAAIHAFRY